MRDPASKTLGQKSHSNANSMRNGLSDPELRRSLESVSMASHVRPQPFRRLNVLLSMDGKARGLGTRRVCLARR